MSDDETPQLAAAVQRICQMTMGQRVQLAADLGETMVVAHAVVAAENGMKVFVVIDDGDGARVAAAEAKRLIRQREQGKDFETMDLINTQTVLHKAASTRLIKDRADMRHVYERLRACDDGLIPIEQTSLLARSLWR